MLHTGAGVVLATPGVVMLAPQTLVRNAEAERAQCEGRVALVVE